MRNIHLPLKNKWFEMTKSGVKTEDYREITPYFCARFLLYKGKHMPKEKWRIFLITSGILYLTLRLGQEITFKEFNCNIMTLGYPKKDNFDRMLTYRHARIEIREGNPDWGATQGVEYFVIKHGIKIH